MRPKSMATVVVRLSGTMSASSTPIAAVVISCSVSRGGISDKERTKVVLPTPNPPAMSTLRGMSEPASACTETIQEPLEDLGSGSAPVGRRREVHHEVLGVDQVTDEHAGDTDRYAERRADLGDRDG